MNRNKLPNNLQDTEHNSSTPNGRKRRLHIKDIAVGNLDKSKTSTANEDEDEDYDEHDDSFQNRKSLRIKNKFTPNQSISPTSSQATITPRKTKENTNQRQKAAATSSATSSSSSISSTSNGNDRKLNGAQFLAAAAAGNFNVSASIGSTSITIDSNTDLCQLNHNVEILTKTLVQHSILLKHLNGSIEKLSNRLDSNKGVKKQYNTKSKQQQLVKVSQNKKSKSNTQDTEMNEEESIEEQIPLDESQTDLENSDQPQDTTSKEIQLEQHQQNQSISTNKTDKPKLTELTDLVVHVKEDQSPKKQQEPQANEEKVNEPVTQTVKLTNIDQLNEETPRQSNSFYYLSDSSKSDDDDDDDEDEDEDEDDKEEDDNNTREGKKNRRSSLGLKSPTKAILNKTKIDTDFISKLIASKDPSDKRYDPGEINKLRLLSHSYQNFAVKLLIRLFDEEEIIGRNVYGRNYSGDKSFMKQPLDPERINFIKETVLKLTKTNNPELAWASCVIAMNRKMVDINNKFIKNQQK